MLKKVAARPLVAQMVFVATIAPGIAKQHTAASDALAITALMNVASYPVIVSLWLKLGRLGGITGFPTDATLPTTPNKLL